MIVDRSVDSDAGKVIIVANYLTATEKFDSS